MALLDRISRLVSSFSTPELDQKTAFGISGEEQAAQIIATMQPTVHIQNPVIPSRDHRGRFCETDHLVFVGGTLFAIEIKNYKGRILRATERGDEFLQMKIGNHGEILAPKRMRNPTAQARSFILPLKNYLARAADPRFAKLRVEVVAAFTRAANIEDVHDPSAGLVYVDELPQVFAAYHNERFADRPSPWIVRGLHQLPRLDVVVDRAGQSFRGTFLNRQCRARQSDGTILECEWKDIAAITLDQSAFLSSHSQADIHFRSGERIAMNLVQAEIPMRSLDGDTTTHRLSNLTYISPSPVPLVS